MRASLIDGSLKKKYLINIAGFIFLIINSGLCSAGQIQEISLLPKAQYKVAGASFDIEVLYDVDVTDGSNKSTNGIGFRIHYNSNKLQYNSYSDVYSNGSASLPWETDETWKTDDGDAATNKIILMGWYNYYGSWPEASLPLILSKLNFTTKTGFSGSTKLNITITSYDPNATVRTYSATIIAGAAPQASFSVATQTISESTTSTTASIRLATSSTVTVNVPYVVSGTATGNGVDYTLESGTAVFTPGQTQVNLPVLIFNDTESEDAETIVITLQSSDTASLGTTFSHTITLNDDDMVTQVINLKENWNIISTYVTPVNLDLRDVFKSLIDEGSLVKVYDETGKAMVKIGITWINSIGNLSPYEGYRVNVNKATSFSISGIPISLPQTISLKENWNIIGYPKQESVAIKTLFSGLMDQNKLIKVYDESGKVFVKIGITWIDPIVTILPGKGYRVRVIEACEVTIAP